LFYLTITTCRCINPNKLKKAKLFIALLFAFSALFHFAKAQPRDSFPFADEIRTFKLKDSLNQPPKGGLVFIGSSSIRKWDDFEQRFPNPKLIRRGVGGSTLAELVDYYMPYILFPYAPSKIFIYEGENDIASGATSAQLMANYKKLVGMIRAKLPDAELYLLSIKYSPSRAKFSNSVRKTNQMLRAYIKGKKKVHYINVTDALLIADGKSDPSLFLSDMLHLNSKGYDRWDKVLRPYFMEQ
jgi:lysophospholipase L1-like esterase